MTPDVELPAVREQLVTVDAIPRSTDRLLVSWLGGLCDRRVTLTLWDDPLGPGLRLRHDVAQIASCSLLGGIDRGVVFDLREPVDAAVIEVEWTTD